MESNVEFTDKKYAGHKTARTIFAFGKITYGRFLLDCRDFDFATSYFSRFSIEIGRFLVLAEKIARLKCMVFP
jgi:hypothetical protein